VASAFLNQLNGQIDARQAVYMTILPSTHRRLLKAMIDKLLDGYRIEIETTADMLELK